jgi:hypothetical protein
MAGSKALRTFFRLGHFFRRRQERPRSLVHGRSQNGTASLAYVANIRVRDIAQAKDVDGRDKPGHDG